MKRKLRAQKVDSARKWDDIRWREVNKRQTNLLLLKIKYILGPPENSSSAYGRQVVAINRRTKGFWFFFLHCFFWKEAWRCLSPIKRILILIASTVKKNKSKRKVYTIGYCCFFNQKYSILRVQSHFLT